MRFDSLEEFLKYFYENNVSIADVEFNITAASSEDPAVTPDVIEEPGEEQEPEEELQKLEESVVLRLPSGDVKIPLDENGHMVVEDFAMTPNACGTGYIVIEGCKLHLDMCEMDGKTVAYLLTNKGSRDAIAVRRKN
jgi:hypothetical protein